MRQHPISLDDVREAARALKGVILRTVAFKFRGADHRMLRLSTEDRTRGAVTYSSGNHALGLARAAKQAAVRPMGAEISHYDRDTQDSTDGVALVMDMAEASPGTHVYAAELVLFDDTRRSLDAGDRVPIAGRAIATCFTGGTINTARFAALMEDSV